MTMMTKIAATNLRLDLQLDCSYIIWPQICCCYCFCKRTSPLLTYHACVSADYDMVRCSSAIHLVSLCHVHILCQHK